MKIIPLTQGKYAIVDDFNYERLSKNKWYAHKSNRTKDTYYAYRKESNKTIAMHRQILGLSFNDKRQVDHRNHNGLDNRISNIWICTHSQNQKNHKRKNTYTSKYIGVYWHKGTKQWRAQIKFKGKNIYIGSSHFEEDAAVMRDYKAKKLLGESAYLNFNL